MESKQKILILRIILAVLFAAASFFTDGVFYAALCTAAVLCAGYDVVFSALYELFCGRGIGEHFLMSLAAVGALGIGEGVEGAAVMIFYQIGELFCDRAGDRSRDAIASLIEQTPEFVRLENGEKLKPEEVLPGAVFEVRPGERIPLDGDIVLGETSCDTSPLTGESLPRVFLCGDAVFAGFVNISGVICVKAAKTLSESAPARILKLIEESSENKSRRERFVSRFAKFYTPAVCAAAVLLAVLPPIFGYGFSLYRSLVFLVVSCPCALVLSVPLAFYCGTGSLARRGVLIYGGGVCETLAKAKSAAFDKTGTLTTGEFSVLKIIAHGISESDLAAAVAGVEEKSLHPLARAAVKYANGNILRAENVAELAGYGVSGTTKLGKVYCGSARFMELNGIEISDDICESAVFAAIDGVYRGVIVFSDEIKSEAGDAIKSLFSLGIKRSVCLTGDSESSAAAVSSVLGIEHFSSLLPEDKARHIKRLSENRETSPVIFCGDGINDAPSIAAADVGVAMGGMGSDLAKLSADVIIADDNIKKLYDAVVISRKTVLVARENTVFSIGVKLLILILAALGIMGMWAAVFADVGVSVISVLNSARLIKKAA